MVLWHICWNVKFYIKKIIIFLLWKRKTGLFNERNVFWIYQAFRVCFLYNIVLTDNGFTGLCLCPQYHVFVLKHTNRSQLPHLQEVKSFWREISSTSISKCSWMNCVIFLLLLYVILYPHGIYQSLTWLYSSSLSPFCSFIVKSDQ